MKIKTLPILTALLLLAGCTFYRAVNINEISDESLNSITQFKPQVALAQNGSYVTYQLDRARVQNDTLRGELVHLAKPLYLWDQGDFTRNQFPDALEYTFLRTNTVLNEGPFEIAIADITSGQVAETAMGKSILTTSVILVGASAAGIATFLVIACGCPHVAVMNPDGTENLQGSLFPGSMFRMLERGDHLVLNSLPPDHQGAIDIRIYNELDEIQYLDQVELLGVNHAYDNIGIDQQAQLIAFNNGVKPVSATSAGGFDVINKLSAKDDISYDFNDAASSDKLSSVVMRFNTSGLGSNGQLVIRGQQSKWLEHTAEVFFQQFGTSHTEWVSDMNNGNPEAYRQNAIEQGISMNAYVMKDGEWQYIGSYENAGTVAPRDLTLPVDLSEFDQEIEVKLECAYAFWNIDEVQITSEWTDELEITKFERTAAVNDKGESVQLEIDAKDDRYVIQGKASYIQCTFNVEDGFEGSLVLYGSGYYNHVRSYDHAMNRKVLRQLKNRPLSTHHLSQMLELQYNLQAAEN